MTIEELRQILNSCFSDTKLPHTLVSQIRYNRMTKILIDYKLQNPLETDLIMDIDTISKSFHVILKNGYDIRLSYSSRLYHLGISNKLNAVGYDNAQYSESGTLVRPGRVFNNQDTSDFFKILISAKIMYNNFNFREEIWK